MSSSKQLLVFTDLDGTLLDQNTYSHEAANLALARLRAGEHTLVIASSKTAAEIAPLRAAIGFAHCEAIVENGAGILPPEAEGIAAADRSAEYRRLREVLRSVPSHLRAHFTGFADWSAEEVAARTGLRVEDAARAKMRDYSEPGIWTGRDVDLARFLDALAARDIVAQLGGRFLCLSFGGTKGARVREIAGHYKMDDPDVVTVALGDAPNDVDMLLSVDIGIIIRNPEHGGIGDISRQGGARIRRSKLTGAAGWNAEMQKLLNEMEGEA